MKKYITLCDITIDILETQKMRIIPKNTVLTECLDGAVYESKKPRMCIGSTWVRKNRRVFKLLRRK